MSCPWRSTDPPDVSSIPKTEGGERSSRLRSVGESADPGVRSAYKEMSRRLGRRITERAGRTARSSAPPPAVPWAAMLTADTSPAVIAQQRLNK
ncbi:hypothetical protein NDU88_003903 [Pleurodeles waltl]|uniref:Uncharacterized protein n=1 Tax=Pleurodeles waltl TaxID=8319 RepID=A0AAV7TR21_PLEWA|nr:hypothetical protein NDU88_003903 [Pleurodeles waltl]